MSIIIYHTTNNESVDSRGATWHHNKWHLRSPPGWHKDKGMLLSEHSAEYSWLALTQTETTWKHQPTLLLCHTFNCMYGCDKAASLVLHRLTDWQSEDAALMLPIRTETNNTADLNPGHKVCSHALKLFPQFHLHLFFSSYSRPLKCSFTHSHS